MLSSNPNLQRQLLILRYIKIINPLKTPVHYSSPASAKSSGYKVQYHRKDKYFRRINYKSSSTPSCSTSTNSNINPLSKQTYDSLVDAVMSPRPPIPRPRQWKRIIEIGGTDWSGIKEIVEEVEKKAAIKRPRETRGNRETDGIANSYVNRLKLLKMELEAAHFHSKSSPANNQF